MILKQINSLNFNDNDVYQLETYSDKIIVNNDYSGIRILDLSLNTIKVIPIVDGLIVSAIYKQPNGNAILIYDAHHDRLIFIDLENYNPVIINIQEFIVHHIWPESYDWQDKKIIFALSTNEISYEFKKHDNIFYELDLTHFTLQKLSSNQVRSIAPSFFNFYKTYKNHNILEVDSYKQTFTFKKNSSLIGFYDYKNRIKNLHTYRLGIFEDLYYHKDNFLTFHNWEKNIGFPKHKIFIKSEDPDYYCLRIKFLDNDNIAILQTNRDDHKFCSIGVYEPQEPMK